MTAVGNAPDSRLRPSTDILACFQAVYRNTLVLAQSEVLSYACHTKFGKIRVIIGRQLSDYQEI